jgi:hypothetical protein
MPTDGGCACQHGKTSGKENLGGIRRSLSGRPSEKRPSGSPTAARGNWWRTAAACDQLLDAVRELESDYPATVARLKAELHRPDRTTVLFTLRFLDAEYTVALVDGLAGLSLSHRSAGWMSEALSRLPHKDVQYPVPNAVWRLLDTEDPCAGLAVAVRCRGAGPGGRRPRVW